jgi:hypothetical protein
MLSTEGSSSQMMWSEPSELRLRQEDKGWYRSGIHDLIPRWRKGIELRGYFAEN